MLTVKLYTLKTPHTLWKNTQDNTQKLEATHNTTTHEIYLTYNTYNTTLNLTYLTYNTKKLFLTSIYKKC